jgi:hypothetical protein
MGGVVSSPIKERVPVPLSPYDAAHFDVTFGNAVEPAPVAGMPDTAVIQVKKHAGARGAVADRDAPLWYEVDSVTLMATLNALGLPVPVHVRDAVKRLADAGSALRWKAAELVTATGCRIIHVAGTRGAGKTTALHELESAWKQSSARSRAVFVDTDTFSNEIFAAWSTQRRHLTEDALGAVYQAAMEARLLSFIIETLAGTEGVGGGAGAAGSGNVTHIVFAGLTVYRAWSNSGPGGGGFGAGRDYVATHSVAHLPGFRGLYLDVDVDTIIRRRWSRDVESVVMGARAHMRASGGDGAAAAATTTTDDLPVIDFDPRLIARYAESDRACYLADAAYVATTTRTVLDDVLAVMREPRVALRRALRIYIIGAEGGPHGDFVRLIDSAFPVPDGSDGRREPVDDMWDRSARAVGDRRVEFWAPRPGRHLEDDPHNYGGLVAYHVDAYVGVFDGTQSGKPFEAFQELCAWPSYFGSDSYAPGALVGMCRADEQRISPRRLQSVWSDKVLAWGARTNDALYAAGGSRQRNKGLAEFIHTDEEEAAQREAAAAIVALLVDFAERWHIITEERAANAERKAQASASVSA